MDQNEKFLRDIFESLKMYDSEDKETYEEAVKRISPEDHKKGLGLADAMIKRGWNWKG